MVDMGDDNGCIHYEYDSPRDQVDAWMLDLVDGVRGNTAIVLPQQRITGEHVSFPHHILPALQAQTTPPRLSRKAVSCLPAWKAMQCPQAWLGGSSYYPLLFYHSLTGTPADIVRIDNQNGGRGCRASKSQPPENSSQTDIQVIDNGSGMCKAGFAGDDAPRAVFP